MVDDGKMCETFHLNCSYYGLGDPKMVWREIAPVGT
jgi:hypothetical protein